MGQTASCREESCLGWGGVLGQLPTLGVRYLGNQNVDSLPLPTCIELLISKDDGAGDLFYQPGG